MALANCVRCKKMFNKIKSPVCPSCRQAEDDDFEKIRDIVRDFPDLLPAQVAEKAEVEEAVVHRMLKEGLISASSVNIDVKCGQCGQPAISASKRLCQSCLEKLNAGMAKAQAGLMNKVDQRKKRGIAGMNTRDMLDDKRK